MTANIVDFTPTYIIGLRVAGAQFGNSYTELEFKFISVSVFYTIKHTSFDDSTPDATKWTAGCLSNSTIE